MKSSQDIYMEEVIPAINKLILTLRAEKSYPEYTDDKIMIDGLNEIYTKDCNSYLNVINIHFKNICHSYENLDRKTLDNYHCYYSNHTSKLTNPFGETNNILYAINKKLSFIDKT